MMVLSVLDDAEKAKDKVRTEEERRILVVAEMIFMLIMIVCKLLSEARICGEQMLKTKHKTECKC